MALQRIHFDTWNRTVRDVLRGEDGPLGRCLILDPPYQRASVWTHEQRINLIKSSLQGLPVGVIFLNDRGLQSDGRDFAVVDGKQRLETYIAWFTSALAVPAGWFDQELRTNKFKKTATYDDLTIVGKRRIDLDFTLATYQTKLKTVAEEKELYLRINYGGTPHEPLRT